MKDRELVWDYELKEAPEVAKKLFQQFGHIHFWLFEGDLGAGKTTLIQELGAFLGIIDTISSPTFSLVNEYKSDRLEKVYHFDLYRLKDPSELSALGIFEIEESGYFCLFEWASAVGYIPPASYLELRIEHLIPTKRRIHIRIHEN